MKIVYILLFCGLAGSVLLFVSYRQDQDRQSSEAALLELTSANESDLNSLEESYERAKAKALSIHSSELRDRTFAEINKAFAPRKLKFDAAAKLREEALSLIMAEHQDTASLDQARSKAEELANNIQVAKEATALLAQIDRLFKEKQQAIEERIAAEERRREEEEMARHLEAERLAQEEYEEHAKAVEEAAEFERQRLALAANQRAAEPTDCCCKMKVDTGLILTNYEYQYRRFDKKKCARPGFWDSHAEGWCVPDSYCH